MLSRLATWLVLAATALVVFAAHPLLLSAVGSALTADESLQPADALIVLAGNSPYRAEHAVDLYHAGWAPRLIISDEPVKTHGFVTTWRGLYEAGIAHLDVPSEAVIPLPGLAESTQDEARRSRDFLLEHGWKRAIVVTDPYHSRRALFIFRTTFAGTGLRVWSSPAMGSPLGRRDWWTSLDGVQRVVSEYAKFAWAMSAAGAVVAPANPD